MGGPLTDAGCSVQCASKYTQMLLGTAAILYHVRAETEVRDLRMWDESSWWCAVSAEKLFTINQCLCLV